MIKLSKTPNDNKNNSINLNKHNKEESNNNESAQEKLSKVNDKASMAKQAEMKVWNSLQPKEIAKLEFNEFEEENYKKRNRKKKIKVFAIESIIVLYLFIMPITSVIVTKNVKIPSPIEIAQIANAYNGNTNFPTAGVQTYLNKNINTIMLPQLKNAKEGKITITQPEVTNINKINDKLSSVYFTIIVNANHKSAKFNCFIQLAVDKQGYYRPATTPTIIQRATNSDKTDLLESNFMKFDDKNIISSDIADKESQFVDNFFKLFYTGRNIDSLYSGAKLKRNPQVDYVNMNNFKVYSKPNKTGFNAVCDITLNIHNVNITTKKYLLIKPSGKTYIISALL